MSSIPSNFQERARSPAASPAKGKSASLFHLFGAHGGKTLTKSSSTEKPVTTLNPLPQAIQLHDYRAQLAALAKRIHESSDPAAQSTQLTEVLRGNEPIETKAFTDADKTELQHSLPTNAQEDICSRLKAIFESLPVTTPAIRDKIQAKYELLCRPCLQDADEAKRLAVNGVFLRVVAPFYTQLGVGLMNAHARHKPVTHPWILFSECILAIARGANSKNYNNPEIGLSEKVQKALSPQLERGELDQLLPQFIERLQLRDPPTTTTSTS